jgi:hypothetical protein
MTYSWSGRGQAVGIGRVVAERLLDEDGNVVPERLVEHVGVRCDRCDDDDSVETGQASDIGDDGLRSAIVCPGSAGFGSRDDVDVASEGAEVAQDVSAPVSTSDLTHDHGRRS